MYLCNTYLTTIGAGTDKAIRIPVIQVPGTHVNKDCRILYLASLPNLKGIDYDASAAGVTYNTVSISSSTQTDLNMVIALDGSITVSDLSSQVPANTVTFKANIEVYKMLS